MTASEYVFGYHALISIPTLLVMALAHYFWQKYLDKKQNTKDEVVAIDITKLEEIKGGMLFKTVYAILPLLPILMLIIIFFLDTFAGITISLSVEVATLLSFVIAIMCEFLKKLYEKNIKVPKDYAVVSYDDSLQKFLLEVELTSIAQNVEKLGQKASSMLIDRLKGERKEFKEIVLSPELVIRDSVKKL